MHARHNAHSSGSPQKYLHDKPQQKQKQYLHMKITQAYKSQKDKNKCHQASDHNTVLYIFKEYKCIELEILICVMFGVVA